MNVLIEKGAFAVDVQVLSFETTIVEGKSTIVFNLDDAYYCEQIQGTVDRKTLPTGHAVYPGYMTEFK